MLKRNFNLEDNLYKKKYIDLAIKDFWKNFLISYTKWVLEIQAESANEIEEIFHEFMNYVIGLHNEAL